MMNINENSNKISAAAATKKTFRNEKSILILNNFYIVFRKDYVTRIGSKKDSIEILFFIIL